MNILLTDDDGYYSPGIGVLADRLAADNNVYVIAPAGNRSGTGMFVHIAKPLEYKKTGEKRYICSGTPVDCIVAGLKTDLIGEKIDLVISGINKGPNLGTDIIYSGTCGAAKQATLFGYPSIAVSLNITGTDDWDNDDNWDYRPLADFVSANLDTLKDLARPSLINGEVGDKPGVFVNINAFDNGDYKGVKQADCCFVKHDGKSEISSGDGMPGDFTSVFWGVSSSIRDGDCTDHKVCEDGYISLSRVVVDPGTEYADLSSITWNF